ncbi:hypothetical protein X727_32580 [Mesorhizobium sp. L103C119B0]|nr:hypothetical protein X727_32580 [Mesorhizobium sp. L103C119B0]
MDVARHAMRLAEIAGEHAGSQAERRVIGECQRLRFAVEGKHAEHRSEQFLPHAGQIAAAGIDDGRCVVEAAADWPCSTGDQHAARGEAFRDNLLDPVALPQRGERTHFGRRILRIADANRLGLALQASEEFILHRKFNQQPRAGDAALAGRRENAGDHRIGGTVEVGVGKDDDRAFATEFERGVGKVFRRVPDDGARRRRTAGEGDARNQRMAGQAPAAIMAKAGEDVDDTGWKAGLMNQFGKGKQRRRPIFGGLEHDGAAGGERRAELDGREEELRIPRHHRGNDADRFAAYGDVEIRLVNRHMRAFVLVGKPAIIAVVIADIGDLGAGFADDLAGVARLEFCKAPGIGGDEVAELDQQFSTRCRSHPSP